jgi:hypothetical protein
VVRVCLRREHRKQGIGARTLADQPVEIRCYTAVEIVVPESIERDQQNVVPAAHIRPAHSTRAAASLLDRLGCDCPAREEHARDQNAEYSPATLPDRAFDEQVDRSSHRMHLVDAEALAAVAWKVNAMGV